MMSPIVARLPAGLQDPARRLGWPALVGLGLLSVAGYVGGVRLPELEREIAELQRLTQVLRQRALAATAPISAAPAPVATAAVYRDGFPRADERRPRILALMRHAAKQGLQPLRTEYRHVSGALDQYRVSMPLEGNYEALRALIEAALREDPALSLDSLQLRRSDARQAVLQAELVWTFHAQPAPRDGARSRAVASPTPTSAPVPERRP